MTRALLLACTLVAGCYGNADRGRAAARLVPVSTDAGVLTDPEILALFDAVGDFTHGPRLVRAGGVRRLAVPLSIPASTVTRVPEGVRELQLFVTEPLSKVAVDPDCRVQVEASWDAGAPAQVVSSPVRASAASGWMELRLTADGPRREPTALRVRMRPMGRCPDVPLALAQSEVTPIAPSRSGKRPNLVLVTLGSASREHLDCEATSRSAWPRIHNRWCARGVFYADAWSVSPDPRAGLSSMLTGEWPHGLGSGAGPLALPALLQREGYVTFGVAPAGGRPESWAGFDTLVEVEPRGPDQELRTAIGRALAFLGERPLEPFFLSLALPPVETAATADFDRALDGLVEFFVSSRLVGRTAFILAAAAGAPSREPALVPTQLRIPLIVVPPARGGTPPALYRTSELAASVDVYATALALTGTPIPPATGARDLTWALEGMSGLGRDIVVSESCVEGGCTLSVATPALWVVASPSGARVFSRDAAGARDEPLGRRHPGYAAGMALLERLQGSAAPASGR